MAKTIYIKLNNELDEGLDKLANLLDPILFDEFIQKLKDPSETRTLEELVEVWLSGV